MIQWVDWNILHYLKKKDWKNKLTAGVRRVFCTGPRRCKTVTVSMSVSELSVPIFDILNFCSYINNVPSTLSYLKNILLSPPLFLYNRFYVRLLKNTLLTPSLLLVLLLLLLTLAHELYLFRSENPETSNLLSLNGCWAEKLILKTTFGTTVIFSHAIATGPHRAKKLPRDLSKKFLK